MNNIKLKYIGNGAFLANVPARDLTEDEVKAFGGVDFLTGSGLYVSADQVETEKERPSSPSKNKNKE